MYPDQNHDCVDPFTPLKIQENTLAVPQDGGESNLWISETWSVAQQSYAHQTTDCPKCQRKFKHKKSLKAHMANQCGQKPRYLCPYCHYRALRYQNVTRHVGFRHPGLKITYIDLMASEPIDWMILKRSWRNLTRLNTMVRNKKYFILVKHSRRDI